MALDEAYRDGLIDDVRRFVRIPSRSSPAGGEEGQLQGVIARSMESLGARVRTFEAKDVPEFFDHPLCHGPDRAYEGRPIVVGELGPEDAPALLVLAHSDTVQICRPEVWNFDPFSGEIRDNAVCGLGSHDDKWGLAAMLTIMRALTASGEPLQKRLIFASTIDEENGVGNGTLLLTLAGVEAETALYLDGKRMNVCIGNMGGSNLYLRPHVPLNEGRLEEHEARLNGLCREFSRSREPLYDREFFRHNRTREGSVQVRRLSDEDGAFFVVSFYTFPGEERATFCADLERRLSDALGEDLSHYSMAYREPWFEPALIPRDTPLIGHLVKALRTVLGREATITTISKQDAFVLTNYADIPTVSFGVGNVSGPGANHQPNERIAISEAWDGCRVAYGAVRRWLNNE